MVLKRRRIDFRDDRNPKFRWRIRRQIDQSHRRSHPGTIRILNCSDLVDLNAIRDQR